MSTASPLPGVIRDKLLAMDRQQRELAAVSGVGIFLCLASAAVGLCLLADAYGNLSPTWRGGFLIGLSAVLLGGIWWFVIRPLWRRRSWAELAAAVERDHPELKERLTTLIELRSDSEFGRVSSPLMREMLAKQTVKAVSNVDFTQALPAGRSLQRGALGLAALAVLLMPFLLPGGRYSLAWSRLLAPWGNYAWGSRLGFEVLDGDRVVARGSDVTLQAKLLGVQPSPETPLAASLEAVDERGVKHRREMMTWKADQEAYEITLPRVEQTFRYRVTSRQAESREYHITAANRPQITAWHIDVQPPAYTGLPAQSLDALGEELTVPEHSRLKLRWQFAEPVAIGSISWPESIVEPTPVADDDKSPQQKTRNNEQDLRFSDDRRSATAELSADVGGSFTVQLTSDLGLESEEPARRLVVIPDQPPEIEIRRDEIVASVRPEDMLSIPMLAQDDYGLTAVEVHWKTSAGVTGSRGLPPEELIDRRIERTWKLDLSDLHLSSGQAVTCRLRAVDNRPVPSLQETWSEPIVVSVSNDAKSAEALELAAAQQSLENELKHLQDAVAEQQAAVDQEHRETAREAVKGNEQSEENREDLEQLRERQQALRDQLERLRAELQQRPLMEKAAGERLPEIERQLAAAEKSLNQAAEASEARDQIEQLSESLDELAKAESELEKLAQESKALAALEQELAELSRLSRLADKLADEAERLQRQANSQAPAESAENGGDARTAKSSEGAEQGDAPPTEEELERLRKETEQLTAKLDDLLRRRPELLDAARQNELQRLERLAEAAERLAEPQAQLAEAMSREAANSPQQASEPKSAAAANDNTQNPSQTSPPTESDNQNPQNAGEPASDQPASADQPAQANQPAASQPANQPTSANQPANSPKSTPSEPAAESRTAEANPPTPSTPNAKAQQKSDAATALEQQIAEAIRQQQQLAREAAELQQASQANAANSPENSNSKPPVSEPAQPQSPESKTGQKSGEQSASDSKSSPPEEHPLEQFAKLSQAAAKSAQAGDLEQAAKQSQSACQACQNAAKSGNSPSNGKAGSLSPDGKSGSPSAQKAGQLAERQEALANEFQRLAQSSEARQQAQQQAQRQLSQAAQSLAKALEQSSQELSQQPLNEQKAGQCASGACQSAKSAGNAMSAASQALAGGKPSEAGQAAKSAGDQLEQAASHARQAAANSPPASPQASQIPGQTAGQVARAANQLQQAQSNLAQAEPPPAANSSQAGQSPSREQSPGESGDKESSPSPGGKPSSQNGSRSNQPGEQPGSESTPNSNSAPGQPNAAVASQEEGQPSPLEQSADNLRQAARALAAACQSCRNPGSGKPGSNGKSNSPGNPGSASRNGDPIANRPDEPGDATQSPEGFVAFGNGSADPISELDPLDATAKPAAGMRNWGRLPKHLESEIVQGQAKKSHPEYSRQIKRYFEKIATPDAKR